MLEVTTTLQSFTGAERVVSLVARYQQRGGIEAAEHIALSSEVETQRSS